MRKRVAIGVWLILLASASPVWAAATLTVTDDAANDCYVITAHEVGDMNDAYWEVKVDKLSGSLYSFKDLTDAGDGQGGHTNYMGPNGYGRSCSMVYFDGRGGNVMTRISMLSGLADRLTFTTAPDNSSFTITYTETAEAASFFHNAYSSGAVSLAPGELLTTISFVIRPPTTEGTAWDWSMSFHNVSAHAITSLVWAAEWVFCYDEDYVPKTLVSETSRTDGTWNAQNPVSYMKWTVGSNALGLTEGRQFIMDYQAGLSGESVGGAVASGAWAGFDYCRYASAFSYSGTNLAADATRVNAGQFLINIAATNEAPVADAGADVTVHDTDCSGSETVALNGGGSTDTDGTIVSYVWTEGATQIATGVTAQVSMAVGSHTILLTVTDDDGATGTDTTVARVNARPTAAAGDDQVVTDTLGAGSVSVLLDGSGSTDSDGTVVSWVWSIGETQIGSGSSVNVSLAVGTHTITLTVIDNDGSTHTDDIVVTVNPLEQATLSYSYGATNATYHYRPLIITATHDSATVWEMRVWVPGEGELQTAHTNWLAGEISSFKDVAHGGTAFEYSPESGASTGLGLMRMSAMQGDFLDGADVNNHGGQTSSYYEFTKTHTITTGITGVLTVRINAPLMSGDDYRTTIAGTYTISNTSGSSYSLWGMGTAGTGSLCLEDGGYASWSIVNPTTAASKPNSHLTDDSDGHPLYELYDWYGSTTTSAWPGLYTKAVVKSNAQASALNMRPGLTFELRADDMDFYYVDAANTMRGSTSVSTTLGVQMKIANQGGVFGEGATLPTGESVSLAYEGIISTLPTFIPPVARAGDDFETIDNDSTSEETVTLDGSASFDPDGSIVSHVWMEGSTQIATGETASVSLSVDLHTITLVVTDDDGETDSDTVVISVRGKEGYTYYVDFDGGNDNYNGRSTAAAFKHCPGDSQATGIADTTALAPGDKVIFKGGVIYRGEVQCYWSGASGNPIVYDGNTENTFGTGRAVIDGSEVLTGWTQCTSAAECGGNPNYASIYWTYLPAGVTTFSANVYEDDTLTWVAQHPNQPDPFWFDEIDNYLTFDSATSTTIVDEDYFTMAGSDYWDGYTYILIWAGANNTYPKRVTGYDQATHTISYETLGTSHYNPGKYAMSNSLKILDVPGEYVVREDQTDGSGGAKIYLWPLTGGVAGKTFTVSVRTQAVELNDESYVTFRGFRMQKASGGIGGYSGTGSAIRNSGSAMKYDVIIEDNEFTMNKSMEGQPTVSIDKVSNSLVDNNHVFHNVASRGMIVSGCQYTSIRNNLLQKNGHTSIIYYHASHCDIIGNTVTDSCGVHANGITVYLDSDDVLVACNVVLDGNIAFTCQESSNLLVAYNVFETPLPDTYTVAMWSRCDGVEFYNNVIMNPGTPGKGLCIGSTGNVNLVARNNIVDGGSVAVSAAGGTSENNIYTSLMWCQDINNLGPGEFVATKSELFVDAANGDYHLKSGSPAINAGVDVGFDLDLEGNAVPQGGAVDVGAYEYAP